MFSLLASLVKPNDEFSLLKQLCYFKELDAVKVMLHSSLTHFPASNIIIGQESKLRIASDIDRKRSNLLVRFHALSLAPSEGFFFHPSCLYYRYCYNKINLLICSYTLLFLKNNSWEMCVSWILLNVLHLDFDSAQAISPHYMHGPDYVFAE